MLQAQIKRLADLGSETKELDFWAQVFDLLDEEKQNQLLENLAREEKVRRKSMASNVDNSPKN